MHETADKYRIWFVYPALIIITLAVYWRVHKFEFINYDDNQFVYQNERIVSGLTFSNTAYFFTHSHAGHWQPLTAVTHMLDCVLYGLNAGGHHITNLVLHVINTLLLLTLLRRQMGALWPSAFVAAVFGLHPIHVESVAWVTERRDMLSTLFLILTIAAYFRYVKKPNTERYLLVLLLFALGLMSKPMLVTLPFVLLLLDYWPLERLEFSRISLGRLVLEKIPLFVLSGISCAITVVVQTNVGTVAPVRGLGLYARFSNAIVSYVRYIIKILWPVDLAVFYPHPGDKLPWWQVLGAAVVLAGITVWVLKISKKHKYLLTGWLWYIGTLVPVIGLVQVGSQSMADRYTYIPSIGLFIVAAWGANDLLGAWKYKRAVLGLSAVASVAILTVLTVFQVGYWHDSFSLFDHTVKVTKENDVAYNNRGTIYYEKGEYDLAIADYNKAIEISPAYIEAYYNRGKIYNAKGQYDLAISDYSKAIAINPKLAEAYTNRGNIYKTTGRYALAISDYDKAIELNPTLAEAYNNRGAAYYVKGEYALAISDYSKAIELKPDFAWAYFNKANACEIAGRAKEAVEAYKGFIQYAPAQHAPYIERARQRIKELER
jgi:tetratricopeptide (TPR) repeat protein